MVTGAARAEAALLVIDANEGVQENSRRHGYMMSMLGIRQLAVLVNKMDLVEATTRPTSTGSWPSTREFLGRIDVQPACFIPVSGRDGDNIGRPVGPMPWYDGPDGARGARPVRGRAARCREAVPHAGAGRLQVHPAGRRPPDRRRDGRRPAGSPSATRWSSTRRASEPGQDDRVVQHARPTEAAAGEAAGFTLTSRSTSRRGEVATLARERQPQVTTRLRVSLFWLGREPLVKKREYILKLGTARVPVRLEEVHRVIDASDLDASETQGPDRPPRRGRVHPGPEPGHRLRPGRRGGGDQPVRDGGRLRDPRRRHRPRGAAGPAELGPREGDAPQLQVGAEHHRRSSGGRSGSASGPPCC